MKKPTLIFLSTLFIISSWAQVSLVKDIDQASFFGDSKVNPGDHIVINGEAYFTADDGIAGLELWKSDGTESGTLLVKDIRSGEEDSEAMAFYEVGGNLLFYAKDGSTGLELWKSDGTEAGTEQIKDIFSGASGSFYNENAFSVLNDKLYFAADDGVRGTELWESDGTVAGTKMVKDLTSGVGGSDPQHFITFNGKLYFAAGFKLWESDGTEAGTKILNNTPTRPDNLISADHGFFFNIEASFDLWFSDGTEAGTYMIKEKYPNLGFDDAPIFYETEDFTTLGNKLFFVGYDDVNAKQLWVTDGTEIGSKMLTDPAVIGSFGSFEYFTKVEDKVFIWIKAIDTGEELWVSDGTTNGTFLLKDIAPGSAGSFSMSQKDKLVAFNDRLYFTTDANFTDEIWETDGTEENTLFVSNENSSGNFDPRDYMVLNDSVLLFFGDDGFSGRELMKFTEPGQINVSLSTNREIQCNGDSNGRVFAQAEGGYPPYMYYWQNGDLGFADRSNLAAGQYTVTIVDTRLAISEDTIILTEPAPLAIPTPTVIKATGANSDGTIEIGSVTGGTSPYKILWNTGDTTFTITDLEAGTYDFTITDANDCTSSSTVILESTSSVSEAALQQVKIFPTLVTQGVVNIESILFREPYSIEVLNEEGKVFKRHAGVLGSSVLNVSEFSAGHYFVKIILKNQSHSKRIVILK